MERNATGSWESSRKGSTRIDEFGGSVLDAALIAGAQRAEHYEIAAYGTLAYFAEMLGNDKAKNLLGQTLDEEKAAGEKLSTIAKSSVNREALMAAGTEEPMTRSSRGSGARRMASTSSRGHVSRDKRPPLTRVPRSRVAGADQRVRLFRVRYDRRVSAFSKRPHGVAGPTRCPFKAETAGSNPAGDANSLATLGRRHPPRL